MKSILYVFHCSSIGGGSYCLLNILKELDRELYSPSVLLSEEGPLAEEIRKLGINVLFMPSMTSVPYNQSLFNRESLRRYLRIKNSFPEFEKILVALKPDIVYLNSMMLYPYLRVAKGSGARTIIHIREHWPLKEHRFQLAKAKKEIASFSDRIIAINNFSASIIPDCRDKTTVVYDWIDFSNRYEYMPFENIFHEDMTDIKVLVFTGGTAPNKGALEVVKIFSSRMVDPNLRLLMLGADSNFIKTGLKVQVKKFLSKLGLYSYYEYELKQLILKDRRIVCIPNTYALKHLFEQAACFISYFTIPHANLALAESIISGTVAIAARTPESEEYTNRGELAFLFEINNREDFYFAIQKAFIEHDKMKKRLRDNSSVIAVLFDKEKNVNVLNRVYASL